MTNTDAQLFDILEAHGQRFLDSFKPQKEEERKGKRTGRGPAEAHRSTKLARTEIDRSDTDDYSHSAEEWTGFGSDAYEYECDTHSFTEEVAPFEGVPARLDSKRESLRSSILDRVYTASTSVHKPDVVVFSGSGSKSSESLSTKMQAKAFMVRHFLLLRCPYFNPPQVFQSI